MITFTVGSTVFIVIMVLGAIAWFSEGVSSFRDRKKGKDSRKGWRDSISKGD